MKPDNDLGRRQIIDVIKDFFENCVIPDRYEIGQ